MAEGESEVEGMQIEVDAGMPISFPNDCNTDWFFDYNDGPYYPYHKRQTFYNNLFALFNAAKAAGKPCSYELIEWDTCGGEIWRFNIGVNRGDNCVMWCARMHGWEDHGAEAVRHVAEWLLTSVEALVARILERNYVVLIPICNTKWNRYNNNYNHCFRGTEIDGNFAMDWEFRPCTTEPWPDYVGPFAESELETRAIAKIICQCRPKSFISFHHGGLGAWSDSQFEAQRCAYIVERFNAICAYHSYTPVEPWSLLDDYYTTGHGWATRLAGAYGAAAWLIEVDWKDDDHPMGGHWVHDLIHYERLEGYVLPPTRYLMQAMCQECENPHGEPTEAQWHEFHHMGDVNGDGFIDITDLSRIGQKSGQTGAPDWIEEDVVEDGIIDVYDLAACGRNYGKNVWIHNGL